MDDKVAQPILDELFSSLEVLETQTAANLQFLKEKQAPATNTAPYLEQAGKSAALTPCGSVRIDYLISALRILRKRLSRRCCEGREPPDDGGEVQGKRRKRRRRPERRAGKRPKTKLKTRLKKIQR
jgi:hypothetical protein